jgi:Mor family transcriptional regulator
MVQLINWFKEISIEDLPAPYQALANVIGIELTFRLVEELGGSCLYLPKTDKIYIQLRNQRIQKEFNGANHKELSKRYKLSTSRIRQILADNS